MGLCAVACWLGPGLALAQHRESFEGPDTSWRRADHDCNLRVTQHVRTFNQAQSGQASEFIQFEAGSGTFIHLIHDVPRSRVIEELAISLWVKSNRAGLRLAARVILPRTRDPRTGKPLSTLIQGSTYSHADTWQKLTIEQAALLVARQVPMLRTQVETEVSDREAYVDLVVLNAYGGPGQTDLWIDELEVAGQVSPSTVADPQDGSPAGGGAPDSTGVEPAAGRPSSSLLWRAIDHQGESFAWLQSLGFNAVHLRAPPSEEQLREAAASGLKLIAPPPLSQSPAGYGPGLTHMLAWDLGELASPEAAEPARRLAVQLRSVPEESRRPIMCLPRDDIWQASRIADLLALEPPGPNGSFPLADLGPWYLQRARQMRMGTRFWASIRTQVRAPIMDQARTLAGVATPTWTLEPEQIRLLAYHAIASGAGGLWFRSESRLDATDRHSILRAKVLQRLNLELAMLEPWAATGQHESELSIADGRVRASVLKTDRSRVLLIMRRSADQQYIAGLGDPRPVTVEVPGVPETDEAYRLVEDGLQRIRQERGTGMRITLENAPEVTAVVVTQDRLVINFLARQIEQGRQQRDRLSRDIAAQFYAAVVEAHQDLLTFAPATSLTSHALEGQSLSQARSELQHYERLIEGGGHERAYEFLQRGLEQLAAARYYDWHAAAGSFPTPVTSPLCVSYFALPHHHALSQRLCGAVWGPNALAGGDFENLQLMQSSGWRHLAGQQADLATAAELSLHAPQAGRSSLRLQCWPRLKQPGLMADAPPPIAIISAPVPIRTGQILRIHGFVRVPSPVQGSPDGLMIYDSLAGTDLAERVQEARDWREFTLYRAAPCDGSVTITFALTGVGEAWLDSVTINLLEPAAPHTPSRPDDTPWQAQLH